MFLVLVRKYVGSHISLSRYPAFTQHAKAKFELLTCLQTNTMFSNEQPIFS